MALQTLTIAALLVTQLVHLATGEGDDNRGNNLYSKRQGLYLRGSSQSAVAGYNFTFSCTVFGFSRLQSKGRIKSKVEITNGTFHYTCLMSSKYEKSDNNYDNFTCEHVLSIRSEDYNSYQGSNWTCQDKYNGRRSNTIVLDVEVPLVEIHIENSTSSPLALTENEIITLVCKTNPTKPSSSITWRLGNQTLNGNVTSLVRDDDDVAANVSRITFTVTCGHHLVGIQCAAVYRNKMLISGTQILFVHCAGSQEAARKGQCFGATQGVGITLCLVSLVAMGATAAYIIHWKRRNVPKDVSSKVAVPAVGAACMTTCDSGDEQRHKSHEATHDTVDEGTYEPIEIYQNP